MKHNNFITIFTPTYNRGYTLTKLYDSLCRQTEKSFDWLIVDDGSTDNTPSLVRDFQTENKLSINYIHKENGGKHTALNVALDIVQTELFFIVDSDDVLVNDAVETICKDWEKVRSMNLCGIAYLKGEASGKVIGQPFPQNYKVDNFIRLRFNLGITGDKAEVWVTSSLQRFRFPVFPGERFMGESYLWIKVARRQDMLHVNKIIYLCEYLADGLTRSGRKMRLKNPIGGLTLALEGMTKEFNLKLRIKNALLYVLYSRIAHRSYKEILSVPQRLLVMCCLPAGVLLEVIWKRKYVDKP